MMIAKLAVGLFLVCAGFNVLEDDTAGTNFWCTCAIIAELISMTS